MPHENLHHRHKRDAKPEPAARTTIVSVVYVTESPTFAGPTAGYTTLSASFSTENTSYYVYATVGGDIVSWLETDKLTVATADVEPITASSSSMTSTAEASVITNPSTTLAKSQTSLLVAPSTLQTSTYVSTSSSTSETATPTASGAAASASAHSSSGMGGALTAGIAIIAIAIFVALFACIFCCVRRRNKDKQQEQALQEKDSYVNRDVPMSPPPTRSLTSATAPQVSMRPITQFSPNLGSFEGEGFASSGQELNRNNPFGTHAAAISNENNSANPFGNHAAKLVVEGAAFEGAALGGAATEHGGAAPAGLSVPVAIARRSLSLAKDLPDPLKPNKGADTGVALSPADSMFSNTNMAAAAGGASRSDPVHRVQIDFKPSMEDEIELAAGDLVKLVNSYDDGWCLVVRLNNTARGVCPRSCLSNRPLKPRPGPGSPGQAGRPMTPNQGRVMTPTQGPGMGKAPSSPPATQLPSAPGQARPMTPSSGGLPSPSMNGHRSESDMSQDPPQSPGMSSRDSRPMTPTGNQGAAASQAPTSRFLTDLSMSSSSPSSPKDEQGGRDRSGSVGQTQIARKNPAGPSAMNQSDSEPSMSSDSQGDCSTSVEDSSSLNPDPISPPTSPLKSVPRNQSPSRIPLPASPVSRKPIPGQAY